MPVSPRLLATALIAAIVLAGALFQPAGAAAAEPLATCFWEGPVSMKRPSSRGFDGHFFNYPEESATYWLARFQLPQGAKVRLRRALRLRPLSVAQRLLRRQRPPTRSPTSLPTPTRAR